MTLTIGTATEDDVVCIEPENLRIDSSNAASLEEVAQPYLDEGYRKFVLNWAQVEFASSAGLRAVVQLWTRLRRAGGNLVVVAPTERVRGAFTYSGLDALVEIVNDMDAARAVLSASSDAIAAEPAAGASSGGPVPLTAGERRRLESERARLEQRYEVLTERIVLRDKQIARTLDLVEQQILEEERAELSAKREQLGKQLLEIEIRLEG